MNLISSADAIKFRNQARYGRSNKAAHATVGRGVKYVRDFLETGRAVINIEEASL